LLTLLAGRGLRALPWEVAPGAWRVDVLGPDAPDPLDLRDLEAPGPLEQVLLACSAAAERPEGGAVVARLPRFPRLLLPHLAERRVTARIHEELDGGALLHLTVPGAS